MGSISLATFQWKQPFPHHMSLKTFVNIYCFRRIVLYQMGAGHRLVKWALNSNGLVSWDSLFLFHFSSLFCPWKSEMGKGCGFPPTKGCRADLSRVWCHVPQSAVQPLHFFLSRRAYFGLAVDSDVGTALVQITFYQPLWLCSGSPQSVTFFHVEYLQDF